MATSPWLPMGTQEIHIPTTIGGTVLEGIPTWTSDYSTSKLDPDSKAGRVRFSPPQLLFF